MPPAHAAAAEPAVSAEGTPAQGRARWPSLPRGASSPLLPPRGRGLPRDLRAPGHARTGPASYSEL